MKELKIIDKKEHVYTLKDEEQNHYNMVLEFQDIEREPEIEDEIYINAKLLNPGYEGYSVYYTFGNLKNKYGKENILMDDIDVIKLILNDKEIYLKRLYG